MGSRTFWVIGSVFVVVGLPGSLSSLLGDFFYTLVVVPAFLVFSIGLVIVGSLVLVPKLSWSWRVAVAGFAPFVAFVGLLFTPILSIYTYAGDRIHFLTELPSYSRYVARLPKNGKRYAEFNWGGMLFASEGIVYDQTDDVALPSGAQSAEWKARMKSTDLTCGGDGPIGAVMPMGGHYYYTAFGC